MEYNFVAVYGLENHLIIACYVRESAEIKATRIGIEGLLSAATQTAFPAGSKCRFTPARTRMVLRQSPRSDMADQNDIRYSDLSYFLSSTTKIYVTHVESESFDSVYTALQNLNNVALF